MRAFYYVQCLGFNEETNQFVWQIISPSNKNKCTIKFTKHGSRSELWIDEEEMVELPNHFVHFCGKLREFIDKTN